MAENKSKKIRSGISWSLLEKLMTEAVGSIISILLARFLFPEDYGLITMVQIFITISSIFVENGFGKALVQGKDLDEEQKSTLFYFNLFLGLFLYGILYIAAPYISVFKGNSNLKLLVRILAIKVPFASVYSMQHAYIQKRMEFKKFFYSSSIGTILGGVVGVWMAFRGWGVWALVANTLIDQIFDCFILLISSKWWPSFCINFAKTKTNILFGLKVLMSELINRTYGQVKPIIIAIKYTSADLALNAKGNKFAYLPLSLISSSVARVLLPTIVDVQEDDEKCREIAKETTGLLMFILAPMLIGLAAVSNVFVPLLLTEKWMGCEMYIKLYCLYHLLGPFNMVDGKILEARGKGQKIVKLTTIGICVDVIILVITVIAFNDPLYLVGSMIVSSFIYTIVYSFELKKEINYGFIQHIATVLPTLISVTIMGFVVWTIGFVKINRLMLLIVQVVLGAIIYLSLAIVLKNKYLFKVIGYLRK